MRERAFIFLLRRDIAGKLGMPKLLSLEDKVEGGLRPDLLSLDSFLLPVTHPKVQQEIEDFAFELAESGLHSRFRDPMLPQAE
jgi:hypothetical protein